jgi:uncharacterized protein YhbP (UPF0306 family)
MQPGDFDWHSAVRKVLDATPYGALATVDTRGAWSCTVWFAYDAHYTLYFLSRPLSRHMRNLTADARVSLSCFDPTVPEGDVAGVQMTATAGIVEDEDVDEAYRVYFGRKFPGTSVDGNGSRPDDYRGASSWKLVRLKPDRMYYFDTRHFDEDRMLVPADVYGGKR